MKKWLLLKNIPILRLEYKNHTLCMTRQNQLISIPYTYEAHIREYPPPPGFNVNESWVKAGDSPMFEVAMGSYDGAEVCELVGLYILHKTYDHFS